ncbi:MAG: MaoC family dehydratase [Candidatus Peribacteraceae bacterium]|jgi:3-hydroxybutyryl-CoA dehydratase
MKYKDIFIGMTATKNLLVSKELIRQFADVTGDHNPLHLDETYAADTVFGGCIAHGMIAGSLISALLAEQFPGSIYLSQELRWFLPVRPGDTVQANFEVIDKLDQKQHIVLSTNCQNQKGETVLQGKAVIKIDSRIHDLTESP